MSTKLKCESCGKEFPFPEAGGYQNGFRICNQCNAIKCLVEGLTCQNCPVREQQVGDVKVAPHVLQQHQDMVDFCAPIRLHNERPIETVKRILREWGKQSPVMSESKFNEFIELIFSDTALSQLDKSGPFMQGRIGLIKGYLSIFVNIECLNKKKGVKSMSEEVEFNFGDKVRDKFTDLEGIVVAKIEYFNGCKQVGIQGRELHDGRSTCYEYVDVKQVELIQAAEMPADVEATGGPMDAPTSSLQSPP